MLEPSKEIWQIYIAILKTNLARKKTCLLLWQSPRVILGFLIEVITDYLVMHFQLELFKF